MEQLIGFLDKYFIYIWLVLVLFVVTRLYFGGRSVLKKFGSIDTSEIVFSEKFASGYSTKSWKTKRSGASKSLHILITDKELILKSYLFIAPIAKRSDLLHRIPLERVSSELKQSKRSSKLYVRFTSDDTGENHEIVVISNNVKRINDILNKFSEN